MRMLIPWGQLMLRSWCFKIYNKKKIMNLSSVLIAISAIGALMSIAMMASFSSLYDAILKKVSISKYILNFCLHHMHIKIFF